MSEIRVLLVDDEEELVATLQERLEIRGMSAEAATSGGRALEMVRERSFDVAVVDLKMPGLDGRKIVEAIRARSPATRVVLITGHGSGEGETEQPPIGTLVRQIQELVSSEGAKS